ncbi:MAG: class IV adenylate cyclase [Anaerolineales bacterium]|nr:class IV adenylate cyclase [Anaerolineales bacterium]
MTTEVEAKFHITDLKKVTSRLKKLGADLLHSRVLEQNWRYDTPDRKLQENWHILRLRLSDKITLTFKGRTEEIEGTSQRPEFEIEVNELEQTRLLLQALGYQVSGFYEKYRTAYRLAGMMITLDELPFGDFIEIEGECVSEIQQAAADLGLAWETNITENYMVLFNRMKQSLGLEIEEISFKALAMVDATPEMWGLIPADR